jgi:FAD/FMN-containing dehydrogenase
MTSDIAPEGVPVDATILDGLRTRLRGPLVLPGEPGYDEHRALWNGMIDRKPAAIARCLGTADVIACVKTAAEHGLPLSMKGGGHNIAGLALADGALTIDTSLMRGVFVDPAAKIAHAQAGCLLGDVDRETQVHGLAAVLGFVSATGIAGLTLGGGFGYLTRRYGWTSDNVRSITVVTAEGKVVKASEQQHADLFWGLRGGGGNFGVANDFEYELKPVGPEVVAGAIAWRAEEAPRVFEVYRALVHGASPDLVVVCAMRIAPPAPWIAKEAHGKPIIALFVCHAGSVAEGEKAVAPLKALGGTVGDTLQRRPYLSQQSLLDATQPRGRRYYWKSEYLPRVTDAMLERYVVHAGTIASPHSAIILFPLDGALNRLPDGHSAVGNRDAGVVLNITAAWDRSEDDAPNMAWARNAWADMRRFSTGGTYINFLTEDDGEERTRDAYRSQLGRLTAIKKAWDPGNLFRANRNITPG